MSGFYEQEWQNALQGASIQPSESVWQHIADEMNGTYGRSRWLTILLVAATITVAFAFPLTIGNSSFDVQPEINNFTELEDPAMNEPEIIDKEVAGSNDTENAGNIQNNDLLAPKASLVQSSNENTSLKEMQVSSLENLEQPALLAAYAKGFGIADIVMDVNLSLVSHEDYYFIPIFEPNSSESLRTIDALGSVGSGSRSVGGGLGGFGLLAASEDVAAPANNTDGTGSFFTSDLRNEEGGTAFSFGLGAELPIGKKWTLVGSLGYINQQSPGTSNMVYDMQGAYQPMGAYYKVTPGTVFLSQPYNYTAINHLINLPVMVKYPLINKKVQLRVGAGLGSEFLVSHSITSSEFGSSSTPLAATEYSRVGLSGLINLDVKFGLSDNYAMSLEGGIRKGITAIIQGGDQFPTTFSAGIVLYYQIKNK